MNLELNSAQRKIHSQMVVLFPLELRLLEHVESYQLIHNF